MSNDSLVLLLSPSAQAVSSAGDNTLSKLNGQLSSSASDDVPGSFNSGVRVRTYNSRSAMTFFVSFALL